MSEDDPRQEHPELHISCPWALPPSNPYKDIHCGQELKKTLTKKIDGEKVKKREEISCLDSFKGVRGKIIKRKSDGCMTSAESSSFTTSNLLHPVPPF